MKRRPTIRHQPRWRPPRRRRRPSSTNCHTESIWSLSSNNPLHWKPGSVRLYIMCDNNSRNVCALPHEILSKLLVLCSINQGDSCQLREYLSIECLSNKCRWQVAHSKLGFKLSPCFQPVSWFYLSISSLPPTNPPPLPVTSPPHFPRDRRTNHTHRTIPLAELYRRYSVTRISQLHNSVVRFLFF